MRTPGGVMPAKFRCPECGEVFIEDHPCPACLCDPLPDTHHADPRHDVDDLTSDQRVIDALMRSNRGIAE